MAALNARPFLLAENLFEIRDPQILRLSRRGGEAGAIAALYPHLSQADRDA